MEHLSRQDNLPRPAPRLVRVHCGRLPNDTFSHSAGAVATLGSFDGFHLGHQLLMDRVTAEAQRRSLPAALISFYPHPSRVIARPGVAGEILELHQKIEILREALFSTLFLVHFSRKLSLLSASEFIEQILINQMNIHHLVIGEDAHIGRGRSCGAEEICELFARLGRSAEVVPFVRAEGSKVGSGTIRNLIARGELGQVESLLGRPFSLFGRVVHGASRGRGLGFPTANVHSPTQILPAFGVYLTHAVISGISYPALTNVGTRPTFGRSKATVECHLLDYHGSTLYAQHLEIVFLRRIREERQFDSSDSLIEQIKLDVAEAKSFFKLSSTPDD